MTAVPKYSKCREKGAGVVMMKLKRTFLTKGKELEEKWKKKTRHFELPKKRGICKSNHGLLGP